MGVELEAVFSKRKTIPPEREPIPPERELVPPELKSIPPERNFVSNRLEFMQFPLQQEELSIDAPFNVFQINRRLSIANAFYLFQAG